MLDALKENTEVTNNRCLSRVTPSVARTVINGVPDVQMELEFRGVGFCGGRKTGEPREKPSEQPTTMRRRVLESNQGHSGGRRALIHCSNHARLP